MYAPNLIAIQILAQIRDAQLRTRHHIHSHVEVGAEEDHLVVGIEVVSGVHDQARIVLDALFVEDDEVPVGEEIERRDALAEDRVDLGRRHAGEGGGETCHRRGGATSHVLFGRGVGGGHDVRQPGILFGILERLGNKLLEGLGVMHGHVRHGLSRDHAECATYLAGDVGGAEDRDGGREVCDRAGGHGWEKQTEGNEYDISKRNKIQYAFLVVPNDTEVKTQYSLDGAKEDATPASLSIPYTHNKPCRPLPALPSRHVV